LLDARDSLRLTRNSIVVLWGDHRHELGEHNRWAKMTNHPLDTRAQRAPLRERDAPGAL